MYHKVLNKHSQKCAATRISRPALNPCRRNMSDVSIRVMKRDVVEPTVDWSHEHIMSDYQKLYGISQQNAELHSIVDFKSLST